jgi:hypothetical protein
MEELLLLDTRTNDDLKENALSWKKQRQKKWVQLC